MNALALIFCAACAAAAQQKIDQIHVTHLDERIVLRADGTAEYHYRGRPNRFIDDERVGDFRGQFDKRWFTRLASMAKDADIESLKDFRVAFPQNIVHLTFVDGEKTKHIELQDRRVDRDPEPPVDLWLLVMAARGVASQIDWKPIESGVRVHFAGVSDKTREIVVRDPESHVPIVILRTHKEEVILPLYSGKYSVEISLLRNEHWTDAVKTPVTVEKEKVAEMSSDQ